MRDRTFDILIIISMCLNYLNYIKVAETKAHLIKLLLDITNFQCLIRDI